MLRVCKAISKIALFTLLLGVIMRGGEMVAAQQISFALQGGQWNENIRVWVEEELLPGFKERHPEIDVEVVQVTGDFQAQLAIGVATGTMWDVYLAAQHSARWAQSIDRFVTAWSDRNDVVGPLFDAGFIRGEQLFVPWTVKVRHAFYRKDLFQLSGLSSDALPDTWDELLSTARRLIRYDGDEIGVYPILGTHQWLFEQFYIQSGGEGGLIETTETWPEREPALRTFDFLANLYDAAYPQGGIDNLGADRRNRFANGQAAILFDETNSLNQILDSMPEPDLIGAFPPMTGTQRAVATLSLGLAMAQTTEHPEAAWTWMKYLLEPENMAEYNRLQGALPTRISLLAERGELGNPILDLSAPLVEYAAPSFLSDFSGMGPINSIISNLVTSIIRREKAPVIAVEEMQREIHAMQENAVY